MQVNHRLLEEIGEINESLIDTYVDISDENVDLSVASTAVGSEGTVVRCCFSAISLGPSVKSMYASAQMVSLSTFHLTLVLTILYDSSLFMLSASLCSHPFSHLECWFLQIIQIVPQFCWTHCQLKSGED